MDRFTGIAAAFLLFFSPRAGFADELGGGDPVDRGGNTGGFWCPSEWYNAAVLFTADGPRAQLKFTAQTWSTLSEPCTEFPEGGGECFPYFDTCQQFLFNRIDNVMVLERSKYLGAHEMRPNLCSLTLELDDVFVFSKLPESDFVFIDLFNTGPNPGWDLSNGAEYETERSGPTDLDDPSQTLPSYVNAPGGSLRFGNENDPPTPPAALCGPEDRFAPVSTSSIFIDGLQAGTEYVLTYWWSSSVDYACCQIQCSDDSGNLNGPCDPGDLWVQVFGTEELDCSRAAPSVATIWPPNHKLVPVTIEGVTDLTGDPASVIITGINQDEPLNDRGDGNTEPDAFGVGTSTALLRAERQGGGNGRVYTITYEATDGGTGICAGSVKVCVGKNGCVDDGEVYDSTRSSAAHGEFRVATGLRVRVYPNPFNPSTRIQYTLPAASVVSLGIYNALGQRVRTLVQGERSQGTHQAVWDGRDDTGAALSSGIYIYRLEGSGHKDTGRLVLIR